MNLAPKLTGHLTEIGERPLTFRHERIDLFKLINYKNEITGKIIKNLNIR